MFLGCIQELFYLIVRSFNQPAMPPVWNGHFHFTTFSLRIIAIFSIVFVNELACTTTHRCLVATPATRSRRP